MVIFRILWVLLAGTYHESGARRRYGAYCACAQPRRKEKHFAAYLTHCVRLMALGAGADEGAYSSICDLPLREYDHLKSYVLAPSWWPLRFSLLLLLLAFEDRHNLKKDAEIIEMIEGVDDDHARNLLRISYGIAKEDDYRGPDHD